MGLFDQIAGPLGQQAAEAIAAKLGLDPAIAQTAIEALTRNHALPNDTIAQSAQETGISGDVLSQIVGQIGGEGGLGALVGALGGAAGGEASGGAGGGLGGILSGVASMLDRDGDGNPLDDIAGMLGKS